MREVERFKESDETEATIIMFHLRKEGAPKPLRAPLEKLLRRACASSPDGFPPQKAEYGLVDLGCISSAIMRAAVGASVRHVLSAAYNGRRIECDPINNDSDWIGFKRCGGG